MDSLNDIDTSESNIDTLVTITLPEKPRIRSIEHDSKSFRKINTDSCVRRPKKRHFETVIHIFFRSCLNNLVALRQRWFRFRCFSISNIAKKRMNNASNSHNALIHYGRKTMDLFALCTFIFARRKCCVFYLWWPWVKVFLCWFWTKVSFVRWILKLFVIESDIDLIISDDNFSLILKDIGFIEKEYLYIISLNSIEMKSIYCSYYMLLGMITDCSNTSLNFVFFLILKKGGLFHFVSSQIKVMVK